MTAVSYDFYTKFSPREIKYYKRQKPFLLQSDLQNKLLDKEFFPNIPTFDKRHGKKIPTEKG